MKTHLHLRVKVIAVIGVGILLGSSWIYADPSPAPSSVEQTQGKRERILFLRGEGEKFQTAFDLMSSELASSYDVSEKVISKNMAFDEVKGIIDQFKPALLVLMDNKAVEFGMKYNAPLPEAQRLKGVALLGLNLKKVLKNSKEFSGVAFEPPPYRLVTDFRYLIQKPLKKIIVFYRKRIYQDTIDALSFQLKGSGLELLPIDLESKGRGKIEVKESLKENLNKYVVSGYQTEPKADSSALWVVLDSGLINGELFGQVWMPATQTTRLPIITESEILISSEMKFGVFAITPNLKDMANQAVQQVQGILRDHVAPSIYQVEDAFSFDKVLNISRAKSIHLSINQDHLGDVKIIY